MEKYGTSLEIVHILFVKIYSNHPIFVESMG